MNRTTFEYFPLVGTFPNLLYRSSHQTLIHTAIIAIIVANIGSIFFRIEFRDMLIYYFGAILNCIAISINIYIIQERRIVGTYYNSGHSTTKKSLFPLLYIVSTISTVFPFLI